MRILVTGSAGFIGSHLCRAALERGDTVWGYDNFNDYYNPEWKRQNVLPLLDNRNFRQITADIRDKSMLEACITELKPRSIVHLAALAGVRPSIQNPEQYLDVNIQGTLNVLEVMKRLKAVQLIFASSSSVYGESNESPFNEKQSVSSPVSPYAATKLAGEALAYTYSHLYGIKTTCLRFFTVYGPCGRPDMAPYKFIESILGSKSITRFGDGTTLRDYTYVEDIVGGITAALDHQFQYEIINLGGASPITLNNFIAEIEAITRKSAKIVQQDVQAGDVRLTFADNSKAKLLLGYTPKYGITEGIERTVEWYKESRLRIK